MAGETLQVGTYTYLPVGPSCAYSFNGGTREFTANCVGDTLGDPIWVFQWTGSAWTYVYAFPTGGTNNTWTPITGALAPLTTETFAACLSVNGGFPAPGSSSTNLPLGCDAKPTAVMMPGHGEHGDG